jgi:NADPH2:quinone reductase
LVTTGSLTTPVGAVYEFEDVPAMIAEQSSMAPGKAVVRVASLDNTSEVR